MRNRQLNLSENLDKKGKNLQMSRINREGKYIVATDSEVITLKQIPYNH